MFSCRRCRARFVDALYDELRIEEKEWFQSHLTSCSQCAALFAKMQATLGLMAQHARKKPGAEFWQEFTKKLDERLAESDQKPNLFAVIPKSSLPPLHIAMKWASGAVAAAALVVLGIFIGHEYRRDQPAGTPRVEQISEHGKMNSPAATSVDLRAERFLDRSQVLLLGIMNHEANDAPLIPGDHTRRSKISRDLIQEASLLKRDLKGPDKRRLRELISDLEVILLQLANMRAEQDIPGLELVRSGVDRRAVFLKINLEKMHFAAGETPQAGAHPITGAAKVSGT